MDSNPGPLVWEATTLPTEPHHCPLLPFVVPCRTAPIPQGKIRLCMYKLEAPLCVNLFNYKKLIL